MAQDDNVEGIPITGHELQDQWEALKSRREFIPLTNRDKRRAVKEAKNIFAEHKGVSTEVSSSEQAEPEIIDLIALTEFKFGNDPDREKIKEKESDKIVGYKKTLFIDQPEGGILKIFGYTTSRSNDKFVLIYKHPNATSDYARSEIVSIKRDNSYAIQYIEKIKGRSPIFKDYNSETSPQSEALQHQERIKHLFNLYLKIPSLKNK